MCLLWIVKARAKDKNYIGISVWWKDKKLNLRNLHTSHALRCVCETCRLDTQINFLKLIFQKKKRSVIPDEIGEYIIRRTDRSTSDSDSSDPKLVCPFHYDFLWLTDWSPHNRSVHLIMSSSGHTPERVGKETKHTMTWQSRVTECHNRTRVCTSSSHQKGTRTYSRESQESVRCLPHSGRGPVVRRQGLGEEDWGLFESSSSFFYWYLITS